MKALIIIFLFVGTMNTSFAQQIEPQSPQELYDFHIKKKKENNTAAWVTLGGGVAMFVAGLGINSSGGIIDNDTTNNNKGLWLSYLGGATTLISVPLFISAGKHNRKAKIQLQNGAVGLDYRFNYSGIALVISL